MKRIKFAIFIDRSEKNLQNESAALEWIENAFVPLLHAKASLKFYRNSLLRKKGEAVKNNLTHLQ